MESKEYPEVNTNSISKFWNTGVVGKIIASALTAVALIGVAAAQDKKDYITLDLIPNPAVSDCLRANAYEEPRAKATVIRGKLNDTLILDLDGIKPGLAFDLFTVQHSPFFTDGSKNPEFNGSFGLAWYQSDTEVGKHTDDGHVRIKTILLDQIFGFDADTGLPQRTPSTWAFGSTTRRTLSLFLPASSTRANQHHSMASTRRVRWP